MKKGTLFSIFASFIMLLSLASCGSSGNSSGQQADIESEAEELGAKYTVPDVVGKEPLEAVEILEKTGFTNIRSNVTDKEELEAYNWIVVSQSVSAGTSLVYDKPISLKCKRKLQLYLDLNSEFNLIFSKYDVDVFVDSKNIGSIANGDTFTYLIDVMEGTHTIEIAKSGDRSLNVRKEIDVTESCTFQCTIARSNSAIELREQKIENNTNKASLKVANVKMMVLSEGVQALKDLGFININYSSDEDSIWDTSNWIIIDQSPKADTEQDKTEKIELKCIKLDSYFQTEFVGKNVLEIEKAAKDNGFTVVFKDAIEYTDVTSFIDTLSDADKELLVCTSSNKGAEKQAVVYLKIQSTSESSMTEKEYDLDGDMIFGKSYVQVRDYLAEKGYSAKYEHENTHLDFTGEFNAYSDSELEAAGWIITDVKSVDTKNKQITLYVNTKENQQRLSEQERLEQELEENFPVYKAVAALEIYGRTQYPYGFSVKMVTGKLAETPIDNNTWFIKYKVKIKDAYGNEEVYNCEAKIHGPADDPTVSDFYVY